MKATVKNTSTAEFYRGKTFEVRTKDWRGGVWLIIPEEESAVGVKNQIYFKKEEVELVLDK